METTTEEITAEPMMKTSQRTPTTTGLGQHPGVLNNSIF